MFAARAALRSPAFRRGIHTGPKPSSGRSSFVTSGVVLAAGLGAYATYHSWDAGSRSRRAIPTEAEKKPRIATTEGKGPARKSQNTSSVDDPAPAKPSPSEPGVLTPADTTPKVKPNPATEPPTDSKPTPDDASKPSNELKDLDEEANSQGAYNPETGEINWDCPCLGGMAHGPCGMQFRDAFSCFVHSEEEPKGVDCVEKFKAMQDCFREHPDVYGEEIDDDDEEGEKAEGAASPEGEQKPEEEASEGAQKSKSQPDEEKPPKPKSESKKSSTSNEPPSKHTPSSADAPPPPSSKPASRTSAPTANVSPDETPTKSASKH